MLKINFNPTFETTAKVNAPALKFAFKVVFKAKRLSEVDELSKRSITEQKPNLVLEETVVSWDELELGGQVVPQGPEGLAMLCDYPGVGEAMLHAFYGGHREAQSGN